MEDKKFYVYSHVDPRTNEICYIGIGQFDRAWAVRRNQRKDAHVSWLEDLYVDGYTLVDVVHIVENNLTKIDALTIESKLVITHKPVFNELLNPNHWNRGRKYSKENIETAKALHEMGYGYINLIRIMGGEKSNHMTAKRMVNQ